MPRVFYKVAVNCGLSPTTVFEVIYLNGGSVHPIFIIKLFTSIFLEKYNIRGDICKGILPKGGFRQTDATQKISVPRDMFPHRRIGGIHEIAADHKGGNTALAQQAERLGEEVIVDREFPQFGKVRVVQRLVAEGWITHYSVYATGT